MEFDRLDYNVLTIVETIIKTKTFLEKSLVSSVEAEVYLLLSELLSVPRNELVLLKNKSLTPKEEFTLKQWLERRLRHEPLQYIIEKAYFYGLELKVTPSVLIPRPETESLVALALEVIKKVSSCRVIDVGTGSGAIALAIKHECPSARVLGLDVDDQALEVAKYNARKLNFKVDFCLSDLLEEVYEDALQTNLIVANLPYLPMGDITELSPEVRAEPARALFAGKDGLELYRKLLAQAYELLEKGCVMVLELDPRNIQTAFSEASDWQSRRIEKDLVNRDRFLVLER